MSHGTGATATGDRGDGGTAAPLAVVAGGLLTFVTAFLPLAPVLGGAVAGYLRRGDAATGARMGALAGLVTVVLLATLAGGVLALVPLPAPPPGLPAPFELVVGVGGALFVAYVLLLSSLGGVCGSFAASEIDILGR